MKKIITISREFGSGGGEITKKLSDKIGYEYYDKAIILNMAKQSNYKLEDLMKWDEKIPSSFGFKEGLFDFYSKSHDNEFYDIQTSVIKQLGEKGNCIILGRTANHILKEYDSSLHVFITSSKKFSVLRMKKEHPEMAESTIIDKIDMADKSRRRYCKAHTGHEFGAADNYDICLNSEKLGIDKCVDIIYELAME